MHDHDLVWTFGFIALAIAAAIAFGWLAEKIRMPKVLGMLIAGIVIKVTLGGTAFLDSVLAKGSFTRYFAELGAMVLLFNAGLEETFTGFWKSVGLGWKVAVVGVVLPLCGGLLYAMFGFGVDFSVGFFAAGVLTATSVGIAAAVLNELDAKNAEFYRIIIAAAVIDDILGLIVLSAGRAFNDPSADSLAVVYKCAVAICSAYK